MRPSASIYRQNTGLVYAIAGPGNRSQDEGAAEPQASVDFARQRKSLPIVFLLPNTQRWLDALPPRAQPHALRKSFPRVANLIVAMWADPDALKTYFDELLVDRRRGRKGFPRDVFRDLRVLRDYHAAIGLNSTRK
jgi:hypothetical protein